MTTHIMISSQYSSGETPRYIKFSLLHQEDTKVVFQHILISMLTICIMPVPPQLKIMLLLEPNLVKEVRHSRVQGHGG